MLKHELSQEYARIQILIVTYRRYVTCHVGIVLALHDNIAVILFISS